MDLYYTKSDSEGVKAPVRTPLQSSKVNKIQL